MDFYSIQRNTKIPKNEFIFAIEFVPTFFTFNNIIYRLTFGTLMGSPLSPIVDIAGSRNIVFEEC